MKSESPEIWYMACVRCTAKWYARKTFVRCVRCGGGPVWSERRARLPWGPVAETETLERMAGEESEQPPVDFGSSGGGGQSGHDEQDARIVDGGSDDESRGSGKR